MSIQVHERLCQIKQEFSGNSMALTRQVGKVSGKRTRAPFPDMINIIAVSEAASYSRN